MKTKREWFETLPPAYPDLALRNTDAERLAGVHNSLEDAILCSFTWSSSPEGHDFWSDVADGKLPPIPEAPEPVEIVITTGCTAGGITFNGVPWSNLTPDAQKQHFDYLCVKLWEAMQSNTAQIDSLVECFPYDDFTPDEEPCDQCGDTVSTTTYRL